MNMRSLQSGPEPCHNCRRQRLKCDRSLPRCLKCVKKGRECLGYGYLLRWDQGVASRGKMAGRTFGEVSNEGARHGNSTSQVPSTVRFWTQKSPHQKTEPSRLWSLADPLVQDADHASRRYLSYCQRVWVLAPNPMLTCIHQLPVMSVKTSSSMTPPSTTSSASSFP